ncbi:hypothetical protein MZD04_gp399 [Pseudomonas phage Psa21]|uniref:Uncharacterized protein n=1 Tax=Pseudomonas phage Psa21 TaxID=2530023 RepID=A0A481W5Y8_9CAUD|nr:hypothetical protein MZD04_gp399 [Pseudomonas phage Psa21]QBJ02925.1 hypothetical protein PSA21_399 [Pseudomonas phage Psa21]
MSYHDNMEKQIRLSFPWFNDKQVRYAINKVSNFIRDCGQDVYQVWVDNKATYNAQYATRGSIWVGRTEVFIEIQVD